MQQISGEIKAQSVAEKGIRDLPPKGFRMIFPTTVRTHSGNMREALGRQIPNTRSVAKEP
ncbi:MAG: hypothetical protein IIY78_05115 [Clostridia bacterium]|nr:hypothetical protein [Clostridia bacterium]